MYEFNEMQELATYGMTPYPCVELTDVYRLLESGYRMEKPKGCPDAVYTLMQRCWQWNADDRPAFFELYRTLLALSESGAFDDEVARELERSAAVVGTDSSNYVLELVSSSARSHTPNTPLSVLPSAPAFTPQPPRQVQQSQIRQTSASPSTQQMVPPLSTFSPSSSNPLLLQQLQRRQMSFQPSSTSAVQQPPAPRFELASPGSRRSFFAGMGLAHQHQHQHQNQNQQQLQHQTGVTATGVGREAAASASGAGARQRPRHKTSEIGVPSTSPGSSGGAFSTGSSSTSGLGVSAGGLALQARSFSLENVLEAVVRSSRPSQFTSVDIEGLLDRRSIYNL